MQLHTKPFLKNYQRIIQQFIPITQRIVVEVTYCKQWYIRGLFELFLEWSDIIILWPTYSRYVNIPYLFTQEFTEHIFSLINDQL